MVLDDFKLVSIDSILHDSCTFHVYKSMRGSKKNSQSSKLPKPKDELIEKLTYFANKRFSIKFKFLGTPR
jgi:hypothetical protein